MKTTFERHSSCNDNPDTPVETSYHSPARGGKTTVGHLLLDALRLDGELGELGGEIAVGRDGDLVGRDDGVRARAPGTAHFLTWRL